MANVKKITKGGAPQSAGKKADDFEKTAAALRRISGRDETVVVPMRCSHFDLPFKVIYARKARSEKFRIQEIIKEEKQRGGAFSIALPNLKNLPALGARSSDISAYDYKDFDQSGRICPWCGDASRVIHCNRCGETWCGCTVRDDYFRCVPRCGMHGPLQEYHKVHGSKGGNSKTQAHKKAIAAPSKPALPPAGRLRLPKK